MQPVETAAFQLEAQAEISAWDVWQTGLASLDSQQPAETAADTQYNTAASTALTAWHASEQVQWVIYTTALANLPNAPAADARQVAPGLVAVTSPFIVTAAGTSKPWDVPEMLPSPEGPNGSLVLFLPAETWSNPASPFFAHTRDEARYRAWCLAPGGGAPATAIGVDVAREFGGISPETLWRDFFPDTEYNAFRSQRVEATELANLSPSLLFQLEAEWRQGSQQEGNTQIGAAVADRWRTRPRFGWVAAQSTWGEFFTSAIWFEVRSAARLEAIATRPTIDADSLTAARYLVGLIAKEPILMGPVPLPEILAYLAA